MPRSRWPALLLILALLAPLAPLPARAQAGTPSTPAPAQAGTRSTSSRAQQGKPSTSPPAQPGTPSAPELVLQTGHRHGVKDVALAPQGDLLATAGDDGTVKLWEIQERRIAGTLTCPTREDGGKPLMYSVAFSPDGRTLATGTGDGEVDLWDVATARLLKTVPVDPDAGRDGVTRLSWHPDGVRLVVQKVSSRAYLLDSRAATVRSLADVVTPRPGDLRRHVHDAVFSPDGKTLALALDEPCPGVLLWKPDAKEPSTWVPVPRKALAGIHSLAFAPDGRRVAVAGRSENVVVLDLVTRRMLARHVVEMNPPRIGWTPAGIFVGSARSTRGQGLLLDPATLAVRRIVYPAEPRESAEATCVGGGNLAALGLYDGHVLVIDLGTGAQVADLQGRLASTTALAMSPDGGQLATGGFGMLTVWNLRLGRAARTLKGLRGMCWAAAFTPRGDRIIAVDGTQGQAHAWGPTGEAPLWTWPAEPRVDGGVGRGFTALALSADGRTVAVGGGEEDGRVVLLDAATGRVVTELASRRSGPDVSGLAFRPGSSLLAVARTDGSVTELDTARSQQPAVRRRLSRAFDRAWTVAYSPDGRYLAAGMHDGQVLLWDGPAQEPVVLSGWGQQTSEVAFSGDGRYLAASHFVTGIDVFDVASKKRVQAIAAPTSGFSQVRFSPDSRLLVSAEQDGSVRLWSPGTGHPLLTAVILDGASNWVAVTPDGLFDGTAEGQRTIQWRVGDRLFSLEQFFNRFYRPGLLAEIAGPRPGRGPVAPPPRATTPVDQLKPPPRVSIAFPRSGDVVTSADLRVEVAVDDQGGGVSSIRLYVNGHRVPDSKRTVSGSRATFEVSLVQGLNSLRATAFNADGTVESRGDHLRLRCEAREETRPVLHVLAVGINRYRAGMNLQFARQDAESFAGFFKPGLFADVQVHRLLDDQADRAGILAAMAKIRSACRPQDALVLFLAGHGTTQGDLYYFVPFDATVTSAEAVSRTCISSADLAQLLAEVSAGKQLVILDSCHSGAAGTVLGRVVASRDAIGEIRAQQALARASGTFLIAATGRDLTAQEYKALGHGVLTSALLQGLGAVGAPAAPLDPSGRITVNALIQYVSSEVPRLEAQHGGGGQDVVQYGTGHDFPLVQGRGARP